jgi:hypothetical protein
MLPHEIPDRPWSKLGADLFELHKEHYLLLVDYYSNFFEVMKLTSTKTPTIIKHCKTTFARHGIPDVLMSDNDPQFDNAEFKQFAKEWTFTHKTSSPKEQRSCRTHNPDLKESPQEGTQGRNRSQFGNPRALQYTKKQRPWFTSSTTFQS